jgi:hypothetical protein
MRREKKKKLQSLNCYFFLFCVRLRYGCIGVLGFEWFFSLLLFVLHLLIVNFFQVVSNSGCRLVKPNNLNLGVVCDYFLLSSYYSHLTGLGENKIYFLTTGIRAFGSSGSDGRRRWKSRKN